MTIFISYAASSPSALRVETGRMRRHEIRRLVLAVSNGNANDLAYPMMTMSFSRSMDGMHWHVWAGKLSRVCVLEDHRQPSQFVVARLY